MKIVLKTKYGLHLKHIGEILFKIPVQFLSSVIVEQYNSLHASGEFCCLLITFANSLDPDQDQQNVGSDLDPICLTL